MPGFPSFLSCDSRGKDLLSPTVLRVSGRASSLARQLPFPLPLIPQISQTPGVFSSASHPVRTPAPSAPSAYCLPLSKFQLSTPHSWKEGTSAEELPLPDYSVILCWGRDVLGCWLVFKGSAHCRWYHS